MNQLIIKPRRSGKTTTLLERFNNDESGIYITMNHASKDRLIKSYPVKHTYNVIAQSDLTEGILRANSACTFYMDEYFFFTTEVKKMIFNAYMVREISIIATGTPRTQYNKQLIDEIREYWTFKKALKYSSIMKPESHMAIEIDEDLLYSLLVAPGFQVSLPLGEKVKKYLSIEQYEIEVLGKIYKGIVN